MSHSNEQTKEAAEEKTRRQNFSENFAAKIIEQLKNGAAPWTRPWKAGEFVPPFNPLTGTIYKGTNLVALAAQGYSDPRWMTLRQANEENWRIKKGEKSSQVGFWQFTRKENVLDEKGRPTIDADGNAVTKEVKLQSPMFKTYSVFHANQIEGNVPEWKVEPQQWKNQERVEAILKNSGAKISHDQRNRAYYSLNDDSIHMPAKGQFPSEEAYYSTALHELAHWTGAPDRLNRSFGKVFGSEEYAREELRAEIASWMISMELGLPYEPDQHLSYVDSWIKRLEKDPYEIVRACQDAEKIKSAVLGFEQGKAITAEQNIAPAKEKPEVVMAAKELPSVQKENVWLNVPYAERNVAKKLGARWDNAQRSWYAPPGTDLDKLNRWIVEPGVKLQHAPPALSPEAEFAERLRDAGLDLKGVMPIMDGELHRVPLLDRPHARDGAYKGNLDGRPAGWLQNHVTGETDNWKYSGHTLGKQEISKIRAESTQKAAEVEKAREEQYQKAAERCAAIWENAPEAEENNPYLQKKGVPSFELKTKADDKSILLIPGRDEHGQIKTIQAVSVDGKRFETGSRKKGAFHVIDPKKEFGQGAILIAEGYATAASVHLATGLPCVAAFDAGNLEPVAKALHEKYPNNLMVIMADNDHSLENNPGLNKGRKAANAVYGRMVAPDFTNEEKAKGLTDFNDLHLSKGLEAVKEQIVTHIGTQIFNKAPSPEEIARLDAEQNEIIVYEFLGWMKSVFNLDVHEIKMDGKSHEIPGGYYGFVPNGKEEGASSLMPSSISHEATMLYSESLACEAKAWMIEKESGCMTAWNTRGAIRQGYLVPQQELEHFRIRNQDALIKDESQKKQSVKHKSDDMDLSL